MTGAIVGIIIGVCYFILGLMVFKKPPKMINGIYGYRTPRAMSNSELWDEAQSYSANLMMQFGVIITIFGIIGFWLTDVRALVLSLVATGFYTFRLFTRVEGRLKQMQRAQQQQNEQNV
ncbi:SdpI family protein [Paenibacillus sp. 2003]|uniref:SdpI family protein n=1 Tax=Paenibacillus TaxID=44249 RepID=UPI002856E962|nr:SdpI family protein [Paenibacillus sp. 2003]MDR6721287.1 putative membrane protein [Paenibacillus sp. 2003]